MIETAVEDWCDDMLGDDLETIGVDLAHLRRDSRLFRLSEPIAGELRCESLDVDVADLLDGTSTEVWFDAEMGVTVKGFLDTTTAEAAATARHLVILRSDENEGQQAVALNAELRLELEFMADVDVAQQTADLQIVSVLSQGFA